jgi:asparaginyl-tRNA synthetase
MVRISELRQASAIGRQVVARGWVRSTRSQKSHTFVELNDGSSLQSLQVIIPSEQSATSSHATSFPTGSCVEVEGTIVKSPGNQPTEMLCSAVRVVGQCTDASYPLQKKAHTLEFLREIPHLRSRTNTIGGMLRVRNAAMMALHNFYQQHRFLLVNTPILTSSDCEGAGEAFHLSKSDAFFSRNAFLTVSGQLQAEAFALSHTRVYTFGPTFRAENSQTTRHLAEFWMCEPEMCHVDLSGLMDNAEQAVKHSAQTVYASCAEDFAFFEQRYHAKKLNLEQAFVRMSYDEAIKALRGSSQKFERAVSDGMDLATEHEKWLCESYTEGRPVFVHGFPEALKPFYVRDRDSFDLLVPGIGELIGGSVREERYDVLVKKFKEKGMPAEDYAWYLELRKFGSAPHGGYGIGFERMVRLFTGLENIRDAIPIPRVPGYCPM